jgi:ribosome-binding factor A
MSKSRDNNGPSQRQLRVGEQLKHCIVETLQRGHFDDPVLIEEARKITVTEVRASPDLKNATAYVMSFGGEKLAEIIEALGNEGHYFQKEIAHKLQLRFTPRLRFVMDESFEAANRIDNILKNL